MCKLHTPKRKEETTGTAANNTLREALALLLRPIARFCLRHSLKVQDFIELGKMAFVEAAVSELKTEGQQPNTSRLSIMTGLHRRDVMRLVKPRADTAQPRNLLHRVLGTWQGNPRFSNKRGKARPLEVEGKESEFVSLVQSVSSDLNPYTVLFELERVGAVKRDRGKVALCSGVYTPRGDVREGFSLLARDSEDLLRAVETNVLARPDVPNLHIQTEYDNIAPEFLADIKNWFLDQGEAFHERAREYLSRFDADLNPKLKGRGNGVRVAIGTFSNIVPQKFSRNKHKRSRKGAE